MRFCLCVCFFSLFESPTFVVLCRFFSDVAEQRVARFVRMSRHLSSRRPREEHVAGKKRSFTPNYLSLNLIYFNFFTKAG